MALSTFLIPVLPAFGALVVLFLVSGICRGLLRVTSAATVAEVRAEGHDVGVASGVYNAGLDIGAILGPFLGGLVANTMGIGPMFQVVAVGSAALYFAVALSTPRARAALSLGPRTRLSRRVDGPQV
jgi:predicted MFS family arabinose efflux permease